MTCYKFKRATLPLAVALALGMGITACSDSQNPPAKESPNSRQAAAANPCAAGNPCAAAQTSTNPCAANRSKTNQAAQENKAATSAPKGQPNDRALPFAIEKDWPQTPYGINIPPVVENYSRPSPYIAAGGQLSEGALAELKAQGFRTVVSLLTEEEGVAEEQTEAHEAGLNFYGLGVSTTAPTWDQVQAFAKIASSPANYPILVHCASSNRVGAIWALYRFHMGVPAEIAIEEGRAAGLQTSREGAVREMMGL
ncbi:fused DSP-PTPase phosphatase/NAD kinase-like protein [Pseudidiomarina salinarum]|uniref:fused DSP-PTPase phosphatase/NAD kinase-like protein n=1 Tax=Pseudidiomarina salinarum TaxID=435908 RepID=UPI00068DFB2B|nr:sulfur transferase domain-containing protein [Pseudidiomarina salinarum]RUO71401.1 hypothetical protein CWI79_08225 [Pseudidiomarina salinarum]